MNNKELVILAGKKQGGGSVTPASIVTATSQMTAQQAEDTLGNIGGEPKKLVVNVTESGGVYSADKTYAEIAEAVSGGKTVVAIYDGVYFNYLTSDDDESVIYFAALVNIAKPTSAGLAVDSLDEWVPFSDRLEIATRKRTDLTPTSVTIATAADNTVYSYGELTALTITAITNPGAFIVRFTSGSTPTTTNFPASLIFPEAFSAEASTRYEINVCDGYALAVGWPVS